MEAASIPAAADAGGEEQGQQQAEAPQVDLTPVLEHIDNRFGELSERIPEPDGGGAEEDGDLDAELAALYEADDLDPQEAQRQLESIIERKAQEKASELIDAKLAPVLGTLTDMQITQGAGALMEQFPELRDEATATAVFNRAEQVAQQLGWDEATAARNLQNPGFIALVYQAGLAEQQQAGDRPGGANEYQLEPGGGGAPAPAAPDIAAGVKAARPGGGLWR